MASTSNNNNNLSESMQPDANFVSIDIRHLECTICMEIYMDPRRLPCGHLYCNKCLVALRNSVGGQHIECPQCNQRCTQPVKQLMSDYLVKDMAENFKSDSMEHRVEVQALIYENIKLRKELEEAKRMLNERPPQTTDEGNERDAISRSRSTTDDGDSDDSSEDGNGDEGTGDAEENGNDSDYQVPEDQSTRSTRNLHRSSRRTFFETKEQKVPLWAEECREMVQTMTDVFWRRAYNRDLNEFAFSFLNKLDAIVEPISQYKAPGQFFKRLRTFLSKQKNRVMEQESKRSKTFLVILQMESLLESEAKFRRMVAAQTPAASLSIPSCSYTAGGRQQRQAALSAHKYWRNIDDDDDDEDEEVERKGKTAAISSRKRTAAVAGSGYGMVLRQRTGMRIEGIEPEFDDDDDEDDDEEVERKGKTAAISSRKRKEVVLRQRGEISMEEQESDRDDDDEDFNYQQTKKFRKM